MTLRLAYPFLLGNEFSELLKILYLIWATDLHILELKLVWRVTLMRCILIKLRHHHRHLVLLVLHLILSYHILLC